MSPKAACKKSQNYDMIKVYMKTKVVKLQGIEVSKSRFCWGCGGDHFIGKCFVIFNWSRVGDVLGYHEKSKCHENKIDIL